MYKFLLIDNHEIFKSSINSLINDLDNKNVFFEAESLEAAKLVIDFYEDINVIILNLAAISQDLHTSIRFLLEKLPKSGLLVITDSTEKDYVKGLIEMGIKGVISISSNYNDLRSAIRSVLNNQVYVSNTILNQQVSTKKHRLNGNGNDE